MLTCAAGRMHNCTCMCCPPTCSHVLPTYFQCPLPVYAATFCPVPTFAATSCPVPTFAATSCPVPTYAVSCCPPMPLHANLMKLCNDKELIWRHKMMQRVCLYATNKSYMASHTSPWWPETDRGAVFSVTARTNRGGIHSHSMNLGYICTVLCVATYYYYKPSF